MKDFMCKFSWKSQKLIIGHGPFHRCERQWRHRGDHRCTCGRRYKNPTRAGIEKIMSLKA